MLVLFKLIIIKSDVSGALNDMTWWGQTTSIASGISEGASQMDTNDAVSDVLLVITDGWDGDLGTLQNRVENIPA